MAAAAQSVEIVGAARLARTLGAASADLRDLAEPESELADELQRLAARRAPRRTGRLASSGRSAGGVVTFGNTNVRYAGPMNFGVGPRVGLRGPHNISATNFFTGAVAQAARMAPEVFEPPVQDILDNVRGE